MSNKITNILYHSARINEIIRTLNLLDYEKFYLTGGTLRNIVWNKLHGFNENYQIEDCDIIFYNPNTIDKKYEKFIEEELNYLNPNFNWSVKNQSRMHIRNGHLPYDNITEALTAFPDTSSAFALNSNWEILAPYGLNDIEKLDLVQTYFCHKNEKSLFSQRIIKKAWIDKWPRLKISKDIRKKEIYTGHLSNNYAKYETLMVEYAV
jgi:hypothetical protein